MPDVFRLPIRMNCAGVSFTHPIDRMPEGKYSYLFNARILEEGQINGRPGYTTLMGLTPGDTPNSIARLNDTPKLFAPKGFAYIGGGGTNLYFGDDVIYNPVDSGYSGDPLSLIPFRPEQSPESWMYVYDKNKQTKVRPDGVLRPIGVAPPDKAPGIDYGVPASVIITDGQSSSGWSATGAASSPTTQDRTNGSTPTIAYIAYNSDSSGWACINPIITQSFWTGERMDVILNSGGGNQETVTVREIHPAITSTTIAAIQYDSGNAGPCSIVLTGNPSNLERNSLIAIGLENIRVLEVINAPSTSTYSIRCSTTLTHNAGDAVTGLLSWYVYTVLTHASTETISSHYVQLSQSVGGAGIAELTAAINASSANGRPIDPANDYLHFSVFLQNPQNVANLQILLTLDAAPNFSFANPGNSYIFTISPDQLVLDGTSGDSWAEVLIPIASGIRSGNDLTRTLANISGVAIQLTTTGACAWGFDWLYLFGTYGPVILPNSPVGLRYQQRYRDSSTGAHSVPGPLSRYDLFPLRESVIITVTITTQPGVDSVDIYRIGGAVNSPLYVGTADSFTGGNNTLVDTLSDSTVLEINQPPDLTSLQPWPILSTNWTGVCMVIGTSVIWLSGTPFDINLVSNAVILIEGIAYQTYGQPRSSTFIELTQDAGYLASANFQIASPVLTAQPLQVAFGPLEGPFAPVIFALGDPLNGGTLYFTNFSDADSASDQNTLELSPPGTDLVSGTVWKGMAFAGNQEDIFCVRYSYLTSIGASNSTSFQWARVNSPSGIWSRWACCGCPIGVAFLGRDGIYIATDTQSVNITDEDLYPLFPHDGQPAEQVVIGPPGNESVILPVDMTQVNYLRLTYCDESLRFSYRDTGGNFNTFIYEIYKKRWLPSNYADAITLHYLVEGAPNNPSSQQILMLDLTGDTVKLAGGNTDGGAAINTIIVLPSSDGGDQRSQKLYVDTITQAGGTGTIEVAHTYDNGNIYTPVVAINPAGVIDQFIINLDSITNLELHRNIGVKYAWTGGPDGPFLMAWEPSGFQQPYICERLVIQFSALSFPGWKHMRRMFPSLISTSDILFQVNCQDGRQFGPFTIPSTAGQYRTFPQMLPHGLKDLAFAIQIDGQGQKFAPFLSDFTIEVKEWTEETYIKLAVFRA